MIQMPMQQPNVGVEVYVCIFVYTYMYVNDVYVNAASLCEC